MKPKEYVITKIHEMIALFPAIKVRYEFNGFTQSHLIEVLPAETHTQNHEYMSFAMDIFFEFNRLFPDESVVYIGDNSLTEIENCELEIEGKEWSKSTILNYLENIKDELNFKPDDLEKFMDSSLVTVNKKINMSLANKAEVKISLSYSFTPFQFSINDNTSYRLAS